MQTFRSLRVSLGELCVSNKIVNAKNAKGDAKFAEEEDDLLHGLAPWQCGRACPTDERTRLFWRRLGRRHFSVACSTRFMDVLPTITQGGGRCGLILGYIHASPTGLGRRGFNATHTHSSSHAGCLGGRWSDKRPWRPVPLRCSSNIPPPAYQMHRTQKSLFHRLTGHEVVVPLAFDARVAKMLKPDRRPPAVIFHFSPFRAICKIDTPNID